jgi:isopentenyldiphosphate isomerase
MSDLAVVTDDHDNITGYKDRHSFVPGEYMRISMVWIENSSGQVLLARRSPNKKAHPNVWGPAASGTVEKGETYESNMYKEADEEIGLTGVKFEEYRKLSWLNVDGIGRHAMVYTAVLDRPVESFKIQAEEVAEVAWRDKQELFADVKANPENYVGSAKLWRENFS